MKKIMLFLAVALLSAPAASFAQKMTVTNINREKTYKTTEHRVEIWYEGELNLGYGLAGKLKGDLDGDAKYSRPFIETVHGVRITKYAFVGAGLGFQYATDKAWEVGMMPVFLNLKGYYPVSEHFAPYVSVDLGYGIGVTGTKDFAEEEGLDLKGGMYASYGIGLNYKRLNVGLGWQHQGMKAEYDGDEAGKFRVNSFFVKVGLKF